MSGNDQLNKLTQQLQQHIVNEDDILNTTRLLESNQISADLSFIAILNEILNNPKYYDLDPQFNIIQLYVTILSTLDSETIFNLYPVELIVTNLRFHNQFTLLVLKILTLKVNSFVKFNSFDSLMLEILNIYLKEEEILIQIPSQIEALIGELDSSALNHLNDEKFQSLFISTQKSNNATLIARLLNLITIACPTVHFNYDFVINPENDDVLLTILIIQFYTNLLDKLPLETLRPVITHMTSLFLERTKSENIQSFLITDISDFLIKLSFITNLDLLKSYNFYVDEDVYFLSKFNANLADDDFLQFLLEYPLFTTNLFPILLNLIKSEVCLPLVFEKLTYQAITSLSIDRIYQLLINLSLTEKGVEFLLNMPKIVNAYIINHDVVYNEIYELKMMLLENLIYKNYNLQIWDNQVRDSYRVMKNGRDIRSEPKVDVADQAA